MNDANVKVTAKKCGNGISLDVVCRHCGKPLSVPTQYGIFCEDHCGEKEAKALFNSAMKMVRNFEKMMG